MTPPQRAPAGTPRPPLPWDEVKAVDPRKIADILGLEPCARQHLKYECCNPDCGSSDAMHAYEHWCYCFSCKQVYTNVDMAAHVWNVEPKEACRELAVILGLLSPVDSESPDERRRREETRERLLRNRPPKRNKQEDNLAALSEIPDAQYPEDIYRTLLNEIQLQDFGREYLQKRGLDVAQAEEYGYRTLDPSTGWNQVRQILRNYRDAELRAAGFPREVHKGYPRIWLPLGGKRHMLVLPYLHQGRVVSIRFRNLDSELPGNEDEPRYLTLLAATPLVPYNADGLTAPYVHVMEGEFNAESLRQPCYRALLPRSGVIGIPGAANWRPEWTKLLGHAKRVITWYDPDRAGNRGAAHVREALIQTYGPEWTHRVWRRVDYTEDANDMHRNHTLRKLLIRAPWLKEPTKEPPQSP